MLEYFYCHFLVTNQEVYKPLTERDLLQGNKCSDSQKWYFELDIPQFGVEGLKLSCLTNEEWGSSGLEAFSNMVRENGVEDFDLCEYIKD